MQEVENINMDTNNSPFVPAKPGAASIGFPDPALINQSLTLALFKEQQSHEHTRVALQDEIEKGQRLGQELVYCNERIRKLQMRMKLMEDGACHNARCAVESNSGHETNVFVKTVEKDIPQLSGKSTTNGVNKITPDNDAEAQNLGARSTVGQNLNAEKPIALEMTKATCEVDDTQLFDLRPLESEGEGFKDTLTSNARRTLRKHFVVNPYQDKITTTPVQQPSNKLIEISPSSTVDEDRSIEDKVAPLLSLFQELPKRAVPEPSITMASSEAMRKLTVSPPALRY